MCAVFHFVLVWLFFPGRLLQWVTALCCPWKRQGIDFYLRYDFWMHFSYVKNCSLAEI